MFQTAEIIAVGSELAQGEIVNTNAALIARELVQLGLSPVCHTVIGDEVQAIAAAIRQSAARSDLIVVTGGLGPTCDDLTREGAALCAGVSLVYHPECEERIRSYYQEKLHGSVMPEENKRQALLPAGSEELVNAWGTAPGFRLQVGECQLFALPGVPRECEAMLRHRVLPWLQTKMEQGLVQVRTLRIFGMGESSVDALLQNRMLELRNPTLAPYAKSGEVELRMTAKAERTETAEAMLDALEREIRQVLGDVVYGRNVDSLEAVVVPLLAERGMTLGTAESCTGGWIAKRITDIPGASQVFRGGVTAYTNEVKRSLLHVPAELLEHCGAVSPQVAEAMAQGAKRALDCDLAVAVTGLAGPESDEFGHTGGTVFLALTDGMHTWVKETHRGTERTRVRLMTAHTALDLVRRYLTGLNIV